MLSSFGTFHRPAYNALLVRLAERRRFLQVLAGPRQVGKTTLARQVMEGVGFPTWYATADDPIGRDASWLEGQWGRARAEAGRADGLLVLDEIQKVSGWAEMVKRLWDEDTASRRRLRVMLLGSAPLLVQRGLSESLAGRFEIVRVSHWSFPEMRDAFGWNLNTYVFFGGYPGAAGLVGDTARWRSYILDSLVETTVSRDVLLLVRVDKPALLRQLFRLACDYSGQVLSYTKMLGQLQEAGNTTTLAHYLDLLRGAGLVAGLQKYSGAQHRRRGSSPKLLALNTGLVSATGGLTPEEAREDASIWGPLVETSVGASIFAWAEEHRRELFYWREGDLEVDFVVRAGRAVVAIEVTGGTTKRRSGLEAFRSHFHPTRVLLVGADGIPIETFLSKPFEELIA